MAKKQPKYLFTVKLRLRKGETSVESVQVEADRADITPQGNLMLSIESTAYGGHRGVCGFRGHVWESFTSEETS